MWWWKSFLREMTDAHLEFQAWCAYQNNLYDEGFYEEAAYLDLYAISLVVYGRLDRYECLLPDHPFPEIPRYLLFWERTILRVEPTLPAAFDDVYRDATFAFGNTRNYGIMGKVLERPEPHATREHRLSIPTGDLVIKQYVGRTLVKTIRNPPLPYKVTQPVAFLGRRRHLGDTVFYLCGVEGVEREDSLRKRGDGSGTPSSFIKTVKYC